MCGITGIWNLEGRPVDQMALRAMTRALAHRGPDGEGMHMDGPLGLGHRRLAILDLSEAGRQPMSYANGRYWITFNGEVYNFLELRSELEAHGHSFVSDSDTEVILAAYAQWGQDCQLRFNGMWAFAIWDRDERILFLSRDRFGVKPLHYIYDGRRFAFASEMKAFLALPWFQPAFDPHIVATVLEDPITIEGTEDCLLQGIKRLRGGYCLTLRPGQTPSIRRWWNTLEHLEIAPRHFHQQVELFRELFFDACRIRMRSDVPLGTALSGGLDSSSVLCTMAQIKGQLSGGERLATDWQKAFVATYPGTTQDERCYAEHAIREAGAIPRFTEMNPALTVEHFDEYLYQCEEIQDIHVGPWMVYREMRRAGVVVSMDGHGGDETLAGYPHYPKLALQDAFRDWQRPLRLLELRTTMKQMHPEGVTDQMPSLSKIMRRQVLSTMEQSLLRNLRSMPKAYRLLRSLYQSLRKANGTTAQRVDSWLLADVKPIIYQDLETDRPMLSRFDSVTNRLYQDFHFAILPTILRNFDRCSMAHGVEIRAPFMDWRLVCYAFSLPTSSKIGGGFTKRVLREAMRGVLPESIRARTSKIGFSNPLADWLRDPAIKTFVLDSVNSHNFLQSEIWNGPVIRSVAEESYANERFIGVTPAWKFIQAMRLIELFHANAVTDNSHDSLRRPVAPSVAGFQP